jgi:hypothetical protein
MDQHTLKGKRAVGVFVYVCIFWVSRGVCTHVWACLNLLLYLYLCISSSSGRSSSGGKSSSSIRKIISFFRSSK